MKKRGRLKNAPVHGRITFNRLDHQVATHDTAPATCLFPMLALLLGLGFLQPTTTVELSGQANEVFVEMCGF